MTTFAALFYVLLIALSVAFTKDKYNMFLLSNVLFLTTSFLFPFLGNLLSLDVISSVAGLSLYIFYFLFFFIFYLIGRKSVNTRLAEMQQNNESRSYLYIVLFFAFFINVLFVAYSIINYGIQGAFINSREVYTSTRTGSGQIYYIAAIFLSIYTVLGLFLFKNKLIHFLVCVVFALPYGTKGKIFLIAMYNFVYFFFVSKYKKEFRRKRYFFISVFFLPLIMIGAFWYTSVGLDRTELFKFIVGYGDDYENNFYELVNNFHRYFPHGHLNGQILFGDSFYPFIPRVLWHAKPLYFGDIYLSYVVFPEATISNVGAPSFGPIGQQYADFGYCGSLVQIFVEQSILGFLLGKFEIKCLVRPSLINFLLLITVSFGGLINLTSTERLLLTLINIIFIAVLFYPMKYKFTIKSKRLIDV
jgi:oligosaccharide repeat unit polymerase